MVDQDMTGDDEQSEPQSVLPTQRRSTYTPPAEISPRLAAEALGVDDDDLAAAIAEEIARITQTPAAKTVAQPVAEQPVAAPSWQASTPGPVREPVFEFVPAEEPAPVEEAPPAEEAEPAAEAAPVPQPEVSAEPAPHYQPPVHQVFGDFEPVPDDEDVAPTVVYDLGVAPEAPAAPDKTELLPPPVRRSLPDEVLMGRLTSESSSPDERLEAMHQLEAQMRLRAQEAEELAHWEESMRRVGTPEALAEVDRVHRSFHEGPTPLPPAVESHPDPSMLHQTTQQYTPEQLQLLLSAPAPLSQPFVHIPPPPGTVLMPPKPREPEPEPVAGPEPIEEVEPELAPAEPELWAIEPEFETVEPAETEPTTAEEPLDIPVLHELVEPVIPPIPDPPTGPFDFDSLLAAPDVPDDEVAQDESTGDVFTLFNEPGEPGEAVESVDSVPVVTVQRQPTYEVPILPVDAEPRRLSVFSLEQAGLEPTPIQNRVGRSVRLFWLWFAANSSVLSIVMGAVILSLGMSLRQAVVATLAGVAISALPLGLGTLAGKWSGQPAMVVSRATFGLLGNILPAILTLITRVFWGAVLLVILGIGVERIFGDTLGLGEQTSILIGIGGSVVIALAIAILGYGLIAPVQLAISVIAGVLVAGFISLTWSEIDLQAALTVGDGSWLLLVTGAVLVFSFVGLVWAVSSADLARYQRPGSSGAASMLWSSFGAMIPAFVLISYGALLAASNPSLASGLVEEPFETLGSVLPGWYPIPLLAAVGLSVLSGVIVTIYSGGFALQSAGIRMPRAAAAAIVGVLVLGAALALALLVGDVALILRDAATTLAVPVAAWAGIFAGEMMIRSRRFESTSLLHRGGVYPDVNWVNLAMLVVASAIGLGLVSASVPALAWEGYLWGVFGVADGSVLADTDLGVLVALGLGLLTPIVAGIPAVRRQERSPAPELD
ncbi:cytosine permease [Cryobacterium sp. BB307]|uniref:purine-cytosine permease family protein n=1 Tax=Cryobacterium sp. BB307 TaxID=2716317 RepID=UPI0014467295|nr:cytosine permease [Cryobacterium sp. BB307]